MEGLLSTAPVKATQTLLFQRYRSLHLSTVPDRLESHGSIVRMVNDEAEEDV